MPALSFAKPWTLAVVCLLLAISCYRLAETVADPDLWGHVRFGQDTLRAGAISCEDPYSYLTHGRTWINHEWLAEVLFASAYDQFGAAGLIAWKVLAGLTILVLCYGYLVRQPLDPLRAAMVSFILLLLLLLGLGCVRPQLFTCLLFTLTLLAIEAADRGASRWLWWLPPLFALWANLHGGYLAGLTVLATWALVFVVQEVWHARSPAVLLTPPCRTIVVCSVLSLLATLLNPYGVDLLLFLLRTATQPRPEISEWLPLRPTSREGVIYVVLLALAFVALLATRLPRRPALLAILAGMVVSPWLSLRHLPLAAVAVVILAGGAIAEVWQRCLPEADQTAPRRGMVVGLVAAGFVMLSLSGASWSCIRIAPEEGFAYPLRAIGRLQAGQASGGLIVYFDWGEYAIWHLGPRVQVSIDGRRETVYADDVRERNFRFIEAAAGWESLLTEGSPDLALVPRASPVFAKLQAHSDWELLPDPDDRYSGLFVRRDSPQLAGLRATPPPALPADGWGRCFP